ncbi:putative steroid dehydrogenase 4 [Toxorhynchites rutilus septentrionalis]|uniref:putative steroid dehydrogenase 4 n=1 Tax=Toxorhynchites rutilus septentrionalis TaxID=329112 RepID=UPI00247A2B98|nr:putative steroid dehydrogenase 4 [Toxorhynchites rutilus septentrionalis]
MIGLGSNFQFFLTLVGAYACVLYLYKHFKSPLCLIWSVLFRKKVPLKERYGRWAVITGASDGIGKEYAKNLARHGLNLMLIARTESKLVKLAEEITSKFGVEVRWIAVDFSNDSEKDYERLERKLSGIEVGILVNNVGMLHKHPAKFEEIPLNEVQESLTVNISPSLRLTHMILPEMKRRRRGILINVTSIAACAAMAYASMYSASKAFMNNFSFALQEELRGSGVECQLLSPMFVNTTLNSQWQKFGFWRLFFVGVKSYARKAVWTLGKTSFTTGHWYHALQMTLFRSPPKWAMERLITYTLRFFRKKIFRKQRQ